MTVAIPMNARLVTFDIGCQQLKVYRRKALDRIQ